MELPKHEKSFQEGDEKYTEFFSNLFAGAIHQAGQKGFNTQDESIIVAAIEEAMKNQTILDGVDLIKAYHDGKPGFSPEAEVGLQIYLHHNPSEK